MRNLTCDNQQILFMVIWLVLTRAETEEISYERLVSCFSWTCFRKVWEANEEIGYEGDCCSEVQMRKNGVTIKRRNSCVNIVYPVDAFFLFLVSWTKWEHWVNQRFYLFVSGVNQGNEEGRWVQDFLVLPQGFGSFPSVFLRARWRNLVRVECLLMIKPMVVDLEVDATLVDGFYYYCFFIHKKN